MAARHTFERVWLEKHIECLKANVADGLSASRIAIVINTKFKTSFSRSSVISKCRVLKIQLKQKPGGEGGRANKSYKAKRPQPAKVSTDHFIGAIGEPPEESKCHYMIGDIETQRACGHPSECNKHNRKTNYCAYHQTLMYQPQQKTNGATRQAHTHPSRF